MSLLNETIEQVGLAMVNMSTNGDVADQVRIFQQIKHEFMAVSRFWNIFLL